MKTRVAFFGGMVLLCGSTCEAAFHLWDIKEVYSNADGTVQFIELFTTFNSQQFLNGHTLTSSTMTFNFTNSSSPTANKHLLLATPGFASLMGGVTPNYTIPVNFFNPVSDTLNFAEGSDIRVLSSIPTDGINSINFPLATTAVNSPTNFAGQTGSIIPPSFDPADFDEDGDVDGDDLADWQTAFGTDASADADEDGDTDGADFLAWQRGYTGSAPLVAAVPEPGAMIVLSFVVGGFAIARCRISGR